ncbi:MAG: hypothetical protein ACT4P3_17180 [Betaproteobacteria bacterium]
MGRTLRCVAVPLTAVACEAGALPRGQVPGAAGTALTHAEIAQALQLATQQLAMHGIVNPTADQIRIALFGGRPVAPSR